ncbi:MAG: 23S rRNA (guanosine(2251)-2'-O)-methyltransferase RlmB [Polyangiales bacterium]
MRLVLGIQGAREAIVAHGSSLRVLVETRAPGREAAPQLEALARFATDRGAKVERVDRSMLDRLAKGERHQGVIVEAPPLPIVSLEDLVVGTEEGAPALVIALDELTDPHNFGAIVRSAVALGATGVLWPEDKSAPLSPAMARASAGAVEHARLCRVSSLPRALSELATGGLAVIGLDASGTAELSTLDLRVPVCLVVGSEGKGLRHATKRACTGLAKLPMHGPIASLNASVAAAIALYEVVRQRAHAGR